MRTLRSNVLPWLPLLLALGCAGQPSSEDAGFDAGAVEQDSGLDAGLCPPNLPPPSDPCLTVCGNERKVGQSCTKGGGECGEFDLINAWLCTADHGETGLQFCTRPCVDDSDCGSGALCRGDPSDPDGSNRGCVPTACIGDEDLDGGQDAGMIDADAGTDAGEADAGDGGE